MLIQSHQLASKQIASLHTGSVIDEVGQIIINPHDLSIVGFYLLNKPEKILVVADIREVQKTKLIIDSGDVLAEAGDLVRLQKVLELDYQLIGNQTLTKSKQKLGKVEEFIIDLVSWKIQKLHIKQPLWRNFTGGTLIVDRRQIIEVTKGKVVVEDAVLPAGKLATNQISS